VFQKAGDAGVELEQGIDFLKQFRPEAAEFLKVLRAIRRLPFEDKSEDAFSLVPQRRVFATRRHARRLSASYLELARL
jgi:hypothetical protein